VASSIGTPIWFHTGVYDEGSRLKSTYRDEYWSGDAEAWTLDDTILPEEFADENVAR
jgi:hypothetical protein